ncbi:UNVERIFIED_CONTAM: UDP-N-acetylmuramoylalanine--D-glutamate ligase [Williamsia faeni]
MSASPERPWGERVLVAGAGVAGASAARFLLNQGVSVTVCDNRAAALEPLVSAGAAAVSPDTLMATPGWIADFDLVVASPGFRPDNPLVVAAADAGLPVWGEVELAWQVDRSGVTGAPRQWLVVTGTNGKTTTTGMIESIMAAAGVSVLACGNIGLPVLDALVAEPRIDVLAVELSSFQLFWAPSVRPTAGVVLNIAEDHLDWHGSMAAYVEAKAIALSGPIAVVGLDDPVAAGLRGSDPDGRTIGFRLGAPGPGELGVVDGRLVDRVDWEASEDLSSVVPIDPVSLFDADRVRPPGPSGVLDALAAAALCRAVGVSAPAVAEGLDTFTVGGHRSAPVAIVGTTTFINDSKATNPHAAQASILGHRRVVWVAGGLLKGASVDELVIAIRDRLAGVVIIGADRDIIKDAMTRHAPLVPTVTRVTGEDGAVNIAPASAVPASADAVMDSAVRAAWDLCTADPDTPDAVVLAPAAASLDMFSGYGARGDSFAASARALPGAQVLGAS